MDFQLQNKIVFVSGSYRGTGHTIAERFVSEGARVIVHGHNLDQLATLDLSPFAGSVVGDLGTQAGMAAVVDQIVKKYDTLDVLVNNYGIAMGGNLEQLSYEDWHAMYDHNLVSVAQLSTQLLPLLKQSSQGRIIHLGTIGSTRPNAGCPTTMQPKAPLRTSPSA